MADLRSRCRAQSAFTLIEVLVTVTIIALLIALLLPVMKTVRDQSRSVACLSQQRQLLASIITYGGDWGGRLVILRAANGVRWDETMTSFLGVRRAVFARCPAFKPNPNWDLGIGRNSRPQITGYDYPSSTFINGWSDDFLSNPATAREFRLIQLEPQASRILVGDSGWTTLSVMPGSWDYWSLSAEPWRHRGSRTSSRQAQRGAYGFVDGRAVLLDGNSWRGAVTPSDAAWRAHVGG